MIAKFLVALAVAYLGWRLWYGFTAPAAKPKRVPARPEIVRARALLGVQASADEAEIRAAHRKLVARAHPDHGGSDEETGRLNAARDLLLARYLSTEKSSAI